MARRRYYKRSGVSGSGLGVIAVLLVFGKLSKLFAFENPKQYLLCFGVIVIVFFLIVIMVKRLFIHIVSSRKNRKYINSNIGIVDAMEGIEFESFLKAHFLKLGYRVKLTKASNDYGTDLMLMKDNVTTCVQAKRYSGKVGIKAVQEITASLNHFNATKGIVITNSYFTKNAKVLANSNGIELWDRDKLIAVMHKNNSKMMINEVVDNTKREMVCPKCNGKLVKRNGRNGSFIGCTNYPKCKFTRNL